MKKRIESYHSSILIFITILFLVLLWNTPPIAQDPHYHNFADNNTYLNIPNFMNVISNIPFMIIGIWGIFKTKKITILDFPKSTLTLFFASIFLTGVGSSYYHWSPDNHTLLWDRLPMTIAFMSLLSLIISLHMENWSGKYLAAPLLLFGIASCIYWYLTELNGHGDLRPYLFAQFFPLLIIPMLIFLFPIKGSITQLLIPMIGFYILAKYFEFADLEIFETNQYISGHSIKHICAACATLPLLRMDKIYASFQSIHQE